MYDISQTVYLEIDIADTICVFDEWNYSETLGNARMGNQPQTQCYFCIDRLAQNRGSFHTPNLLL